MSTIDSDSIALINTVLLLAQNFDLDIRFFTWGDRSLNFSSVLTLLMSLVLSKGLMLGSAWILV
ncbi:MAG: hypothetical protein ACMUEM_07805 [Flavobacteriales bacterium AspAUS03]